MGINSPAEIADIWIGNGVKKANLLPVTIGNLISGACVIPFAYYYAYKK